jgi:hypothetical protein
VERPETVERLAPVAAERWFWRQERVARAVLEEADDGSGSDEKERRYARICDRLAQP